MQRKEKKFECGLFFFFAACLHGVVLARTDVHGCVRICTDSYRRAPPGAGLGLDFTASLSI
jgi:hypothetical protein